MPSTLEILKEARKRISDPDKWTQYAFARTRYGASVDPLDPGAWSYCTLGALRASSGSDVQIANAMETLAMFTQIQSLAVFNDDAKHHEVLEAFDKAIEACSK